MSADLCSRPLPRGVLYEKERRKESRPASGFVFLCNNRTERECLDNRVFGLHEPMKYRVFQVKEGDILFLHNYQANRLHGVFEAVSNGGMNLVPYAFGGKYPAQVRVRRKLDCPWVDKGALLPLIRKGHIRISRRGIPIFPDRLGQRMIDELYRIFLEIPPQFRTKMIATDFKAEDGHYTNSYGERHVDNWLHRHLAFKHIYSYAKELDGYTMRCDWYIPDLDLYIEYWEEPAPASADTVDLKRKLYADHFLRVIHLYENDLPLLDHVLPARIAALSPKCKFQGLAAGKKKAPAKRRRDK
mgnify:CR=1 FL=1